MRLHRSAIEAAKAVARIPDPLVAARRRYPDLDVRSRRKLVEDLRGEKKPLLFVTAAWTDERGEGQLLRHYLRLDSSPAEVERVETDLARAVVFNAYMEPA